MNDATRIVLIALGVALIVIIVVPALLMGAMMIAFMSGGGLMGRGAMQSWMVLPALVVMMVGALIVLIVGVILLRRGLRRTA